MTKGFFVISAIAQQTNYTDSNDLDVNPDEFRELFALVSFQLLFYFQQILKFGIKFAF
jgi:hypothetical protein